MPTSADAIVPEMSKPAKPYPDFPLTPHGSGKWVKKIKGKHHYFGKWDDPNGALREYNAVKDALLAGRDPVLLQVGNVTIRDMFNAFLSRQLSRVDAGKLAALHYHDQHRALKEFAAKVGPTRMVADLGPSDFGAARDAFAKHLGPHAINRSIVNIKAAFNWGRKAGKISEAKFGDRFDKASMKEQRKAARVAGYARGKKLFTPLECRKIVAAADVPLKAFVLLGLNAGFYAIDVSGLPAAALDLDAGWLEYPRSKTEVMRVAPLWPETVKAIRAALDKRTRASNPADSGLVFITQQGNRYIHEVVTRSEKGITKATRSDAINQRFKRLLIKLGIRRPGINFSALRSTFRTTADHLGDDNAVHMMMGHSFKGMDAFYLRDVNRKRLVRVANHVRKILLNPKKVSPRSRPKSAGRRTGRKGPRRLK